MRTLTKMHKTEQNRTKLNKTHAMKNTNKNEGQNNKTQQNSEPACNRKTPTNMKAKATKPQVRDGEVEARRRGGGHGGHDGAHVHAGRPERDAGRGRSRAGGTSFLEVVSHDYI